jgi:hypothetical protein
LSLVEDVFPVLVLAPLRVARTTWPEEVTKWEHLSHLRVSVVTGSAKERLSAIRSPADIYACNYDNLVWLVETLGEDFDSGPDAFLDTAAAMEACDLIITSDTSIAHLAGALGRPVWIALRHSPEWRWFLERNDTPWYPSARLFRQASPGDWGGVFTSLGEELRRLRTN